MEVREFQKKIIEFIELWHKEQKHTPTDQSVFNHLVEEVGELARQFVNRDKVRKEKYDDKEVENAIGDIFIHLVKLADLKGLDMEKVVLKILKTDKPNDKKFL